MKRIILALVGVICVSSLYSQERFTIGELTYEVIRKREVKVYKCNQKTTEVDIPAQVRHKKRKYKVTEIGNAFKYNQQLTRVNIPNTVRHIGKDAFAYCSSLTSITIPNSVTKINGEMFWNCINLKSITIPVSVTNIGNYTFWKCTSLTTINYAGTSAQWNAITKGVDWDIFTPSNKVINYSYTG